MTVMKPNDQRSASSRIPSRKRAPPEHHRDIAKLDELRRAEAERARAEVADKSDAAGSQSGAALFGCGSPSALRARSRIPSTPRNNSDMATA